MSKGGKYYLVGFMGCGKTAVGERLAALLGVDFLDLDRSVEAGAGRTIAGIFAEDGEKEFRRLERRSLETLAQRPADLVVATGGGTFTRPENVTLMRETGTSIWLDPPFDLILSRLDAAARKDRPLFESPAQARQLFDERRRAYSQADLRVELGPEQYPLEIAERILGILSMMASADRQMADLP